MWHKFRWPLAVLFLFIAGAVFWLIRSNGPDTREFVGFSLNGKEFTAVVSQTTAEITLGLSGRQTIGADAMLFLMPAKARHEFWMYGMKFPLDFIWLADGQVVDLHQSVPAPTSAAIESIATVSPTVPADSVLEVPAGFIAEHAVEIGQEFSLISSFSRRMW